MLSNAAERCHDLGAANGSTRLRLQSVKRLPSGYTNHRQLVPITDHVPSPIKALTGSTTPYLRMDGDFFRIGGLEQGAPLRAPRGRSATE